MSITKPTKNLSLPFATGAPTLRNNIPNASASPLASYNDGFPVVNMLPITAGGIPPEGQDFNGILYDITTHTVWVNAGGQYTFDATLAATIGGYPVGIVLQNNAGTSSYVNILAGNSTDFNSVPGSIGVSWIPWAGAALTAQGTIWCGTATGTGNAIILTPAVPLGALVAGQGVAFKAAAVNTGATTVNISGLGVRNLINGGPLGPAALVGNEIQANNLVMMRYDGAGNFQLIATALGAVARLNVGAGLVDDGSGNLAINAALFSSTLYQLGLLM